MKEERDDLSSADDHFHLAAWLPYVIYDSELTGTSNLYNSISLHYCPAYKYCNGPW
jgi:hypothetical protein